MKLAIDTFSYYMHFGKHWYKPSKPFDIYWYLNKCMLLGVDGLHIDPYHMDINKDMDNIADFAKDNNLYLELGACGTSVDDLAPYIDVSEKFNVKILRTFVGGSCLNGRKASREKALIARKELVDSVSYAKEKGVKIAVENHGDLFIEDLVYLMEISSDNIGICFDSGNFAFTREDPLKALDILGEKIICTHMKDVCSMDKYPGAEPFQTVNEPVNFCALGEGVLPIKDILEKVFSYIPGIGITLEICSPCIKDIDEEELLLFEENNVIKSIKHIRRLVCEYTD